VGGRKQVDGKKKKPDKEHMRRLASKTAFLGFEWSTFLAQVTDSRVEIRVMVKGRGKNSQSFLIYESYPRQCGSLNPDHWQ